MAKPEVGEDAGTLVLVLVMGFRRCVRGSRVEASVETVEEVEWAGRCMRNACGTGVGGFVVSMNLAHARSRWSMQTLPTQ